MREQKSTNQVPSSDRERLGGHHSLARDAKPIALRLMALPGNCLVGMEEIEVPEPCETVEKVSGNDAGGPYEDVLIGSFPLFIFSSLLCHCFRSCPRAFTRHSLLAKDCVAPGTAPTFSDSGQSRPTGTVRKHSTIGAAVPAAGPSAA